MNLLPFEIAESMLELRGILNMTQAQMAKHLGVAEITISRIENGQPGLQSKTKGKLMKLESVYREMKGSE